MLNKSYRQNRFYGMRRWIWVEARGRGREGWNEGKDGLRRRVG